VCYDSKPKSWTSADFLSWSRGGNQLASGSDDTFLNIWDYNPVNVAKPFTLNTSVSTGHHANIFSVKFMPHSNDRTVITCAGDSEVRVFDLEYSGTTGTATDASTQDSTRSRRFNRFFSNARWLNDTSTNARVYRSHADRVKRVVTESSPHLFLTCSEDGEVRQWDLRQPSSFYPAPSRVRRWLRYTTADDNGGVSVPPPLISYKKYALDLNSISCSASQPHYIALGGAHLHCFLHDRRMLGRDLDAERGKSVNGEAPIAGSSEDDSMNQATRCVRRFAPNNKRKMKVHDNGHITACKISDARPNELIASWSGDHIYSFDIVKSPDARDKEAQTEARYAAKLLKHQSERKRKRVENASSSSLAEKAQPSQRLRRVAVDRQEASQTVLVQYEDGESAVNFTDLPPRRALLAEARSQAERVAHAMVKLRKTMFEFTASVGDAAELEHSSELTPHTAIFTNILGQCTALLPQMDEIIRGWTYPVNPSDEEVNFQNTLRRNRQRGWRFVQAAGVLARTLGGTIQTTGSLDVSQVHFGAIKPANCEERHIEDDERFCYDFLKAITLWLSGGRGRLFSGFRRQADTDAKTERYPLGLNEGRMEVLHQTLSQYLHNLADENTPIIDIDANKFLADDRRNLFANQKLAVTAFMRDVEGSVLATNGQAHSIAELEARQTDSQDKQSQAGIVDKGAAARFWAVRVGRSLLIKAAEGVTFDFVRRAFGGVGVTSEEMADSQLEEMSEASAEPTAETTLSTNNAETHPRVQVEDATDDHDDEFHDAPEANSNANADLDSSDDENDNPNDSDDDFNASDSDDDTNSSTPIQVPPHMAFTRRQSRAAVNASVPYSTHTRCYRGHLNARTVKDVNYYGLDDEYVVSGSDDGHFFIWDRKTGKVVNILKGDGEIVNVVTGHPVEPMLAVSGIDSTIKIFGPGGRERRDARHGVNVANPGGSVHSSLRFGGRLARRYDMEFEEGVTGDNNPTRSTSQAEAAQRDEDDADTDSDEDTESHGNILPNGLESRKAMHRNYEIMTQNDVSRREEQGGDSDFLIGVEGIGGATDMQLLFARAWMLATMQGGI
jgi:nuclear receptor interaction protein